MEPPYRVTRRTAREAHPLLRVLFSCPSNELLRDYLAELIHSVSPSGIAVATVIPSGIREEELLETAVKQNFDVGVLVLNNIFYPPHDQDTRLAMLTLDGVSLVRKMTCLFRLPIIALYGWPRIDRHAAILIRAGATSALRLPFETEEMKRALKRCLRGTIA